MFGIENKIRKAVVKAAKEFVEEFFREHIQDSEVVIVPDLKNKTIKITLKGK